MRSPLLCVFLAVSAPSSVLNAKEPGDIGGTYAGEIVVRSLSATRVVVALDEHGFGQASQLFVIDTEQPVGPFASRSSVSTVEYASGKLIATVPSEHRLFVFSVSRELRETQVRRQNRSLEEPRTAGELAEADPGEYPGLETIRIERVVQLAQYGGLGRRVSLAEIESGRLGRLARQVAAAPAVVAQNPEPPPPPDGSGCRKGCSATCGDGSNCNITCAASTCGSCDCVAGHGASCSCF